MSTRSSTPPPPQHDSSEQVGEDSEIGSLKSLSFVFWKAFAREDLDLCKRALRRLVDLKQADPTPFSEVLCQAGIGFGEESTEAVGTRSGKFTLLPSNTPRKVVEAWSVERVTTLMRVDPAQYCLAFDGDVRKDFTDATTYFIACAQRIGTSPDSCAVGTHTDAKRPRMSITEPAYAVRVRTSSQATKPKVLAGVTVLESRFPSGLIESGIPDMLEDLEAPPAVWCVLLKGCPSAGAMSHWYATRNTEDWYLATRQLGDDEDILSPIQALPRSSPSDKRSDRPMEEIDLQSATSSNEEPQQNDDEGGGNGEGASFQLALRQRKENMPIRTENTPTRASRTSHSHTSSSADRSLASESQSLRTQVEELREQLTNLQNATSRALRRNFESSKAGLKKVYQDVDAGFDKIYARVEDLETQGPRTYPSQDATSLWRCLDDQAKRDLASLILDEMDLQQLITRVSNQLAVPAINRTLTDVDSRLLTIEEEFSSPQGVIQSIQDKLEEAEARRDTASSVRGGYIFRDQSDVEALVAQTTQKEFYKYFLDVISFLTLAQDPFSTYMEGVKIHADAIKAKFDSLLGSRIKLSFETPYPETILRTTDNQETARKGGTNWAPRFATAALFDDQMRTGVHRQMMDGIEKTYEMMQKQVDTEFPIRQFGRANTTDRKIHTIISDHNRMGYRQATAFIESLLPIYRTFLQGGLTMADSWERTRIYVVEFITSIQESRLISIEATSAAAMIWGSFKATDLAEEFKRQKFIEHPKVVSILALTSIEREGKLVADAVAAAKGDKEAIAKLDKCLQGIETQLKTLKTKNPDLK